MSALNTPRTWHYYACDEGDRTRLHFIKESARLVRFTGASEDTIVPVIIVEDENGAFTGWVDNQGVLMMVQPNHAFEVQFPGGSAEAEAKGRGKAVKLKVEKIQKGAGNATEG